MKYFIVLVLLNVFWIVLWSSTGYFYDWWIPTHYFKPKSHLIWFIPISILCWVMWVNGKDRFWSRLYIYPLIIIVFFISINFTANLIVSAYTNLNLLDWTRSTLLILALLLVLLLWNYLFALYEKRNLRWKVIFVLFFSEFFILLFQYIWGVVVFKLTKSDFGFSVGSGGVIFGFIFYEGIFYLWIKNKFGMISRPLGSNIKIREFAKDN